MPNIAPFNVPPVMALPLPAAWTNALSYMEMIAKLVKKMNEVIEFVNDVVAALPIDYNLQQISSNISALQTASEEMNTEITALNTAVGMPYTGTALKTRIGTLEFNQSSYVESYNAAIGMPYSNPDSLNTRVTALENET